MYASSPPGAGRDNYFPASTSSILNMAEMFSADLARAPGGAAPSAREARPDAATASLGPSFARIAITKPPTTAPYPVLEAQTSSWALDLNVAQVLAAEGTPPASGDGDGSNRNRTEGATPAKQGKGKFKALFSNGSQRHS